MVVSVDLDVDVDVDVDVGWVCFLFRTGRREKGGRQGGREGRKGVGLTCSGWELGRGCHFVGGTWRWWGRKDGGIWIGS